MAQDQVVHGYAQALFAVAEAEGALDAAESDLYELAAALERSPELLQALTDATLPAANKEAVVRDLLGERAHPVTASLAGFVVASGRAKEFGAIVREMATIAAERRRHVLAEVRTAVPLTPERRQQIAAALSAATGLEIEVKEIVDPAIVGGVVAHVGDEVFDGSLASRLDDAKQRLGR